MRPGAIVELCWLVLGSYWLITGLGTKKVAVNESAGLRVFRLTMLALLAVLLATDWLRIGVLGRQFVPRRSTWHLVGAWLTVDGSGAGNLGALESGAELE